MTFTDERSPKFDVVLTGGRVMDPSNGLDEIADVAVRDGKIAALAQSVAVRTNQYTIDVSGDLVLPGLIDTHAHIFRHVTGGFGLPPDLVGVNSGVTTLVDQGGPSCITLPAFREYIDKPSETQILAFLSCYVIGGLEGHYYSDLYGPHCVDVDAAVTAIQKNRDIIRGVKAHAEIGGYSRWGDKVVRLAKEIARQASVPLYIHLGQLWPLAEKDSPTGGDHILPYLADLAEPGDVLAHPFTRHPGGFVGDDGKVHPVVEDMIAKGVKVDIGHGSHFSFDVARRVLDAGIMPDTLGADMHGYNTKIENSSPEDEGHLFGGDIPFGLCSAMTELLALGLTLEEIVPMVTSAPAQMLGIEAPKVGLGVGSSANISVLKDSCGRWRLSDNDGVKIIGDRFLEPKFCFLGGKKFEANASIIPVPEEI